MASKLDLLWVESRLKTVDSYRDNPVSDDVIRSAEEELGVVFSRSYVWFLQNFGNVCWPDYIYGLGAMYYANLSILYNTRWERDKAYPAMARELVPFGPDGFGNHFCLDTSALVDGECPVVFWNHDDSPDQVAEVTDPTFADWLMSAIQLRDEFDRKERKESCGETELPP